MINTAQDIILSIPKEDSSQYRESPNNIEAEQALLGAILVNNEAFYRVSDYLKPLHFFEAIHQKIFEIMGKLDHMGKTANPVTVKTFLSDQDMLGELTVPQYLARLASEAVSIINTEDYGRIIYGLALRRTLITIGEEMVNAAYEASLDKSPSIQIEEAERKLFHLAENGRYDGGFHTFSDAMTVAIDMAGQAFNRDGRLAGVSTGIQTLDKQMGGLQRSDLIIIAGRPGMGKTSLATNIAYNVADAYKAELQTDGSYKTINGGIVGFYSLEMSSEQLATRIISEQTEVPSSKIRRGELTRPDYEKIVACSQVMQKLPLYIDQTGGISMSQLATRARRLKRQRGLDLLIVDYIQLMTTSKKIEENRVLEITGITMALKALAKELNIPIIALSQLSRQVENRDNKRPQLSDLRESGSIEQDADVVLFVIRDEYYIRNKEPTNKDDILAYTKWQEDLKRVKGIADIIIAKQRHGPTGTVTLAFQAEFTRFSALSDSSYQTGEHFDSA
ncbi:replicative DNA helicase [Candidatus Liberibacter asiaticus]